MVIGINNILIYVLRLFGCGKKIFVRSHRLDGNEARRLMSHKKLNDNYQSYIYTSIGDDGSEENFYYSLVSEKGLDNEKVYL